MLETKNTPLLQVKNFWCFFNKIPIIKDVSFELSEKKVYAIVGRSGCGKTSLLRCINRIAEIDPQISTQGSILFQGADIFQGDVFKIRKNIGMVFQNSLPFPSLSIAENVTCGYKLNGIKLSPEEEKTIVENNLQAVNLWEEVQNNLHRSANGLSGGQKQRLCIARTLALSPKLVLMDEPSSALDPASTQKIEILIREITQQTTVLMVTHNVRQIQRISDYVFFMDAGEIIEHNFTNDIFSNPKDERVRSFLYTPQ